MLRLSILVVSFAILAACSGGHAVTTDADASPDVGAAPPDANTSSDANPSSEARDSPTDADVAERAEAPFEPSDASTCPSLPPGSPTLDDFPAAERCAHRGYLWRVDNPCHGSTFIVENVGVDCHNWYVFDAKTKALQGTASVCNAFMMETCTGHAPGFELLTAPHGTAGDFLYGCDLEATTDLCAPYRADGSVGDGKAD